MWNYPKEDEFLIEKIGKYAKIAGVLFVVLGLLGIFYPMYMTLATVAFVSWLMLFAGISAGYFTWVTDKKNWMGWLKSFLLIIVSLYMLFSPLGGAATLGLLLSIYFFMDAFAGYGLASSIHPQKGWWIWALNATLSLGLGVIFILAWPMGSMYLVGIFVGISLFFDGIALLMGSSLFKNIDKQ